MSHEPTFGALREMSLCLRDIALQMDKVVTDEESKRIIVKALYDLRDYINIFESFFKKTSTSFNSQMHNRVIDLSKAVEELTHIAHGTQEQLYKFFSRQNVLPLSDYGLSKRTCTALIKNGVYDAKALYSYKDNFSEIFNMNGIGAKAHKEIREFFKTFKQRKKEND